MAPHPSKVDKGGEDAYFANEGCLAIADGVGGWNEVGVDPSKYSRELCQHIADDFSKAESNYRKNPRELLIKAANQTKSVGSSTCCIVTLDPEDQILLTANLGDSGYLLMRWDGKVMNEVYKSEEQTIGFNFPLQIGTRGHSPELSVELKHEVKNNDFILVASDGLFDNMDSETICQFLGDLMLNKDSSMNLSKMVKALIEQTYKLSRDKNHSSPFAKRAAEHGYRFRGGKSDDITIIFGQIALKIK